MGLGNFFLKKVIYLFLKNISKRNIFFESSKGCREGGRVGF